MRADGPALGALILSLAVAAAAGCGGGDAAGGDAAGGDASGPDAGEAGDPCAGADPLLQAPPIHTPRWAFEPWVSKDISDQVDTLAFVEGFRSREIPVGAVVVDSPWETNYNTFVPNPERYPDLGALVETLHADGVRVVLWITSMVNRVSFDLEAGGDRYDGPADGWERGQACGFFVDGGAAYGWWKGAGASLDFFDPAARAWWHRKQDPVLGLGIDGWKIDFSEDYLPERVETDAGAVSRQAYGEAYYRDFYAYGARGRPEFVTMVRAWDATPAFEGRFHARPEHAPVAWMGDNTRDWAGLVDALDHMFRSARAGYVMVGSDIGGYLDVRPDGSTIPYSGDVFARWTAIGALSPFMQLHGRANLAPWTVPEAAEETVALYRYWATLHHELVPFFFSLAQAAYAGGEAIVRPVGEEAAWVGDWRYRLGDALLVAPILDASGARPVALPEGAAWYDWWAPGAEPLPGGTRIAAYDARDRSRIPLFVREGAIIPVTPAGRLTGVGLAGAEGEDVLLVWPAARRSTFDRFDEDGASTQVEAVRSEGADVVRVSRLRGTTWLRVRSEGRPVGVTVGGRTDLPEVAESAGLSGVQSGWWYDRDARFTWVKLASGAGSDGAAVEVRLARLGRAAPGVAP